MPGKVPQVLGLVERLPVAGPPKGERFRLCPWLRSMPGKGPQVLGLIERLPVAEPPKGERFRLWSLW